MRSLADWLDLDLLASGLMLGVSLVVLSAILGAMVRVFTYVSGV